MLKNFMELYDLDIAQYVSKKPTFKRNKSTNEYEAQEKKLDYLAWCTCLMLLYQNGAEEVRYGNYLNQEGHTLFLWHENLPEVHVWVQIDGKKFDLVYPVIDGSTDIKMEKIAQSDIHNASQRAFVKDVAINTGLGLRLWEKEEKEAPAQPKDDISIHNVLRVAERIKLKYADKLNFLGDADQLNDLLHTKNNTMKRMFDALQYAHDIERELDRIR